MSDAKIAAAFRNTDDYCGATPPDDIRTRAGQGCIMHGTNHPEHRSFDLKWPNLNYRPVVGGLLEKEETK